jgi:hypothetical protein
MIRLLTLFTLIFCFGCDEDCGHLQGTIGRILEEAKCKYGLINGRVNLDPIAYLDKYDLCFEYPYKITQEEATFLIVSFTEELIKNAKTDPKIIAKFGCNRFSEENLSFIIKFPCNSPDFNGIGLSHGIIHYYSKTATFHVAESYTNLYSRVCGCELSR